MHKSVTAEHTPPISPPAAARRLGVSNDVIYRLIASGDLPAHRVGRKAIRIHVADLEKIITPIVAGR